MKKIFTIVVITGFFLYAGVNVYNRFTDPTGIKAYERTREKLAYHESKELITNMLKAPSTAKFCKYQDADINLEGYSKYRIKAWVESSNPFGVPIRLRFDITLLDSGSEFYCTELIFDGEKIK